MPGILELPLLDLSLAQRSLTSLALLLRVSSTSLSWLLTAMASKLLPVTVLR
jgi:hypothetical protein